MSVVYLLHFDAEYVSQRETYTNGDGVEVRGRTRKRVRHYVGYAEDLDARMREHRSGNGARLMRAVSAAGIAFRVARVWMDAGPAFEKQIKARKRHAMFCPICTDAPADIDRATVPPENEDDLEF